MPPNDLYPENGHGSAADEDVRDRCISLLLPAKPKQPGMTDSSTAWLEHWADHRVAGISTGDTIKALEAKLNEAKKTRDQLLAALTLAGMTVFTVDLDRTITMLEGALARRARPPHLRDSNDPKWYIGYNVHHMLDGLYTDPRQTILHYSLDSVLEGKSIESFHECEIGKTTVHARTPDSDC
jgi:hypothetical protein